MSLRPRAWDSRCSQTRSLWTAITARISKPVLRDQVWCSRAGSGRRSLAALRPPSPPESDRLREWPEIRSLPLKLRRRGTSLRSTIGLIQPDVDPLLFPTAALPRFPKRPKLKPNPSSPRVTLLSLFWETMRRLGAMPVNRRWLLRLLEPLRSSPAMDRGGNYGSFESTTRCLGSFDRYKSASNGATSDGRTPVMVALRPTQARVRCVSTCG